jgi:ABC-type antimicrobial peptide transport system permease subunit
MPQTQVTPASCMVAALFFVAILASLSLALVALMKRGDHSQTLLRALTIRVGLSVAFFLLLLLGWYLGILEPHGLGG